MYPHKHYKSIITLTDYKAIITFANAYFRAYPQETKISRKFIFNYNGQQVKLERSIIKGIDATNKMQLFEISSKKLGEGSYGKVKLARCLDPTNPILVAAKVQKNSKHRLNAIKQEELIQQAVSQYVASTDRKISAYASKYYNFSHYIEGKPLYDIFYREKLNPPQLYKILDATLGALQDLHSKDLIHGDINLNNILVEENQTPHFIDWGFSGKVGKDGFIDLPAVNRPIRDHYWAPECWSRKAFKHSDVYSLGWQIKNLGSLNQSLSGENRLSLIYLGLLMQEENMQDRLSLSAARSKIRDFITNPKITPNSLAEIKTFNTMLKFLQYASQVNSTWLKTNLKDLKIPVNIAIDKNFMNLHQQIEMLIQFINQLTPTDKIDFIHKNADFIKKVDNINPLLSNLFLKIPGFKESGIIFPIHKTLTLEQPKPLMAVATTKLMAAAPTQPPVAPNRPVAARTKPTAAARTKPVAAPARAITEVNRRMAAPTRAAAPTRPAAVPVPTRPTAPTRPAAAPKKVTRDPVTTQHNYATHLKRSADLTTYFLPKNEDIKFYLQTKLNHIMLISPPAEFQKLLNKPDFIKNMNNLIMNEFFAQKHLHNYSKFTRFKILSRYLDILQSQSGTLEATVKKLDAKCITLLTPEERKNFYSTAEIKSRLSIQNFAGASKVPRPKKM